MKTDAELGIETDALIATTLAKRKKLIYWNKYNRFWVMLQSYNGRYDGGLAVGVAVILWNVFGKRLIVDLIPVPKSIHKSGYLIHLCI